MPRLHFEAYARQNRFLRAATLHLYGVANTESDAFSVRITDAVTLQCSDSFGRFPGRLKLCSRVRYDPCLSLTIGKGG